MFLVGLTGGIASGKSSVARFLRQHGIPVIDADVHARKVVQPGKPAWKRIKSEFGDDILMENGELDREKLGIIIFQDRVKRKKLNEITHPEIYKGMFWETLSYVKQGYPFVVLDLPLLFESGLMVDYLHKIIVVTCEKDQQLHRLVKRDNINEHMAEMKIESQMSLEHKAKQANFVIDNSGSLEETKAQVDQMVKLLKADKFYWKIRIWSGLAVIVSFTLLWWIIHGV